jgi:hypothetical protein
MDKVKPNSEPETLDAPSTFGGRRPSYGSAQVDLPARLLRLVVQVEDTPENRKALLAVRETAMSRSFTEGHSVVKLEHVIVVGCDALNAGAVATASTALRNQEQ